MLLETLLANGKYKVLENLVLLPEYTASVCIDVETENNYRPLIINTYLNADDISRLLPLFYAIRTEDCNEFSTVIPGDRCIMAIFNYYRGIPLKEYLKSIKEKDYPARAAAVGAFLDAALVLDMLPQEFAVAALKEPNTLYDGTSKSVKFNFLIRPRTNAEDTADTADTPDEAGIEKAAINEKRTAFLGYLGAALIKNRYLPFKAEDFLNEMQKADISKLVPLCAAWRQISAAAMEEYEDYLKESYFGYLKRRLRRWREKRKKRL